jgi:hypothetical protein
LVRFHKTYPFRQALPHPHFRNQRLPTVLAQPYAAQYLAINPVADPSKPPQKTTVSAGKMNSSPNYFSFCIFNYPTPIPISPFFFRVFVAVLGVVFSPANRTHGGNDKFGNYAVMVP